MKRLFFAVIMAVLFFVILNFIYCNLGEDVFGYKVIFKFSIPSLIAFQSTPLPLGFILLLSFSAGMIVVAILEALPSFFKTLELRSKNKKIRQLERELEAVRKLSERPAEKTGWEDKSDSV